MTEQLAFEQRFGQRAHIDRDHQFGGPRGEAVYFTRQHLFPGPVLPGYQDIGIGHRHFVHQQANLSHRLRSAPEHRCCGREFLPHSFQKFDFFFRFSEVVGRKQRGDQLVVFPGLYDKIGSAFLDCTDSQVDIGVSCKHDDLDVGIRLFDLRQPVDPFVPGIDSGREIHIQQHHVHAFVPQRPGDPIRQGNQDYFVKILIEQ